MIQGNRGYGCSAWKDGCKFVLWPTYKDRQLEVSEIRELLQHGVLQRPIELAGVGRVILSLTDSGAVTDIPVPERESRSSQIEAQTDRRHTSTKAIRQTSRYRRGVSAHGRTWQLPFMWGRSTGTAEILQLQWLEGGVQVRDLENDCREEDQHQHGQDAADERANQPAKRLQIESRQGL